MRLLLSGAAIIGLLGTIPEPASAQFYGPGPWCAVTNLGIGNMYWDCQFWSFQHCASNVIAGNRGFCNQRSEFSFRAREIEDIGDLTAISLVTS